MCKLCETNPVYEFTNQRKLCKTCFVRWFQKKVLYTIRRFEMIKSGEVVGYEVSSTQGCTPTRCENLYEALNNIQKNIVTKGSFRGVVLEDVLKMFAEKAIVELVRLPSKVIPHPRVYPEKFSTKTFTKGKIAIASTTDLEADKIIHVLITGKGKLGFPKEGKIIKPLYLFLDKEVLLYAKLRKLTPKGVPRDIFSKISTKGKFKKDNISNFINEMEKLHPEVKQAIVSSYLGS